MNRAHTPIARNGAQLTRSRVLPKLTRRRSLSRAQAEGKAFQGLLPQFAEKNVSIVGCSNDDEAKNKSFADCEGFTFPLLCDEDLSIAVAYGASVDGSEGKAARIAALIGPDGKIAQYHDPAGKGEFPAQVLAAL